MSKRHTISFGLITLACLLGSAPVWAHGAHCHLKGADGKLTDFPDAKNKKACDAKGGVWKHHHAHCHKAGGKHADLRHATNEKACLAQGGKWADHGHDAILAE